MSFEVPCSEEAVNAIPRLSRAASLCSHISDTRRLHPKMSPDQNSNRFRDSILLALTCICNSNVLSTLFIYSTCLTAWERTNFFKSREGTFGETGATGFGIHRDR